MLKYFYVTTFLTACISQTDVANTSKNAVSSNKIDGSEIATFARDGNVAIWEEFEAAKRKDTAEAYALFIARHPNHKLATKAKIHQSRVLRPQK